MLTLWLCDAFVFAIWIYDNARSHAAKRSQLKILELDLETIDHHPYSPGLLATDYYLFRNLDNFLQTKIIQFWKI